MIRAILNRLFRPSNPDLRASWARAGSELRTRKQTMTVRAMADRLAAEKEAGWPIKEPLEARR